MKRNKFNLSYYKLLTCDMGELIPVGLTEVLPGDTVQHASSVLTRVSPLLAPVMHPVHVRVHHWYVPFRLIWEDWEDFITGGPDGLDASAMPYKLLSSGSTGAVGSLADYLGCPTGINNLEVCALPFRAYQLIFNEWYRDQDLVTEAAISTGSGVDGITAMTLQNVAWEKDYFTSARPWTQKGPEVTIPLSGNAPIQGLGVPTQTFAQTSGTAYETDGTASTNYTNYKSVDPAVANQQLYVEEDPNNPGFPNIWADLSNVTAANINDLRLAFALQRYEEARARYGSRYTEYLRYLGVRSSDARLQRPEYLGGGKQTLQFSEVLQTGPDSTNEGVADLKGHGIGALRSNRYRRFFEEHGYVVSLMSVLPKTMYVQGLPRLWNRRAKEDFWQKELEHIGQQEIQNREIYGAHADPTGTFGYQDRYDEYRRNESCISGEFRSSSLDFWHMARIFSAEPVLNSSFVTSNPTKRINAVQTDDVLWCMVRHSMQARRMVSKTGRSYIF